MGRDGGNGTVAGREADDDREPCGWKGERV